MRRAGFGLMEEEEAEGDLTSLPEGAGKRTELDSGAQRKGNSNGHMLPYNGTHRKISST